MRGDDKHTMAAGGKEGGADFAQHAAAVARELWGEPNKKLSKPDELRFGTNGSMSVDVKAGKFYDHESKTGGGVLWAIEVATGATVEGGQAIEWLREHGFYVPDSRDAPVRGGAGAGGEKRPNRFDPKGNWLPAQVPDNAVLAAVYPYTDAEGKLRYETCRFQWPDADNPKGHGKTFLQRQPGTTAGSYRWNLKGVAPLLYRLPELLVDISAGDQIYFCEGEKKVDMLRELGVPATCNSGGAGKFPESLAEWLTGAKVILIPDNDDAGRAHVKLVGNALEGVALWAKVLTLPDVPEKGSVDDWLPAGGTLEKLYDLAAAAPLFEPGEYISKFGAITWEHIDDPGPNHEDLIKGVLTRGELSMLLGESQSGKSFVAIDISMAICRAIPWNKRKTRGGLVIYQAGESARGVRRRRLPAYRQHYNVAAEPLPFVLLQLPLDLYKSDEDTDAFIEECKHWQRRSRFPLELIVIDTFNKATPGANENDGKDVGLVLARCDRIRRETGAHVMLVHHLNAAGTKARGHTSLYANLENVLLCQLRDGHHDADSRQVREVKLAKQKEGEDGIAFPFVLPSIQIGFDEDGEPVTSCIVAPPSGIAGAPLPNDTGITVGGPTAAVLQVIYGALAKEGIFAPVELGLPMGTYTVTQGQVRQSLAKIKLTKEDEDADGEEVATEESIERRKGARKAAFQRARTLLFTKGIIGMNDDYIWLTGKPVRGFPAPPGQRKAAAKAKAEESKAALPFDDGEAF